MSMSVCVSVCLRGYLQNHTRDLYQFFVHVDVAYVRRSVLLRHVYDRPHRLSPGKKVKVKVGFLYSATYMVDQEQRALTISEVAVDWQEPVVLRRKCGHPLPALTDIGPTVATYHRPNNHTRPSPRKHSPDVTTSTEIADTRLPIY